MAMNGSVVIVTGSSGLIGSSVVNRLAENHRVVGFDREGPPRPPPSAECVSVDLTSDDSVRRGLERVRIGYGLRIASVVHLAAYYDFAGEPSPLYEQVTVRGTERMLRGLKSGGFEVEQFLFSSTMLVHAPTEPGKPINEDSPLDPRWDYPKSKVKTENLIRAERDGISAVMLRVAGVYTDRGDSIPLTQQVKRIYERQMTSHLFPGDTSRGQAFVHLDDVIEAIRLCVEKRKQLPDELALLIGEPLTLSYETLQREFGRLIHGEEWETTQISKAVAKAGAWVQDTAAALPAVEEPFIKPWMIDFADDHYELNISRARRVLEWQPKHSLRETLPKMVAALKRDPAGFYKENELGEPPANQAAAT